MSHDYKDAIAISAKTGIGVNDLLKMVENELFFSYIPVKVNLPYQQGRLISIFHEQGKIEMIAHKKGGVMIEGKMPARYVSLFEHYFSNAGFDDEEE
jgi:GTP-binding protein HflX